MEVDAALADGTVYDAIVTCDTVLFRKTSSCRHKAFLLSASAVCVRVLELFGEQDTSSSFYIKKALEEHNWLQYDNCSE